MFNKKFIKKVDMMKFDIKSMGGIFITPIIILIFTLIYCKIDISNNGIYIPRVIKALEICIPVMASWWTIFSLQDSLETNCREVIFTYPISRCKIGILRTLKFFCLYSLLLVAFIMILKVMIGEEYVLPLLIQFISEATFFYGFSFFLMIVTCKAEWTLFAVLAYTTIQVMTQGKILWFINIYFFSNRILPMEEALKKGFIAIAPGIVLLILGHIRLKRFKIT